VLNIAQADLDPWPEELLARPPSPVPLWRAGPSSRLRIQHPTGGGEVVVLPIGRWHGLVPVEERNILAWARGPVLDIGCGPGRHVAALVGAGQVALGIDVSAAAVAAATRRGATAARVSVFGDVPSAGRWATALLLDGNIGIGGDPAALLARVHQLLAPRGAALVELDPPEMPAGRFHAYVEHAGRVGPRFPWARVGPAQIHELATSSRFEMAELRNEAGRWFARLDRLGRRSESRKRPR
jgi:SAM-dependent methyltransferase